jgi:hypothetical protein
MFVQALLCLAGGLDIPVGAAEALQLTHANQSNAAACIGAKCLLQWRHLPCAPSKRLTDPHVAATKERSAAVSSGMPGPAGAGPQADRIKFLWPQRMHANSSTVR